MSNSEKENKVQEKFVEKKKIQEKSELRRT